MQHNQHHNEAEMSRGKNLQSLPAVSVKAATSGKGTFKSNC